jgi:hypothetical protein
MAASAGSDGSPSGGKDSGLEAFERTPRTLSHEPAPTSTFASSVPWASRRSAMARKTLEPLTADVTAVTIAAWHREGGRKTDGRVGS